MRTKMITDLFHIVADKTIIKFLLDLYKKNKSDDWPDFDYSGSVDIFSDIFDFPPEVENVIEKYRKKSCI